MNTDKIRAIRWCTGGCAKGPHHAHFYTTDPVDGKLDQEYLCPGNLSEAKELIDEEGPTHAGFIDHVKPDPPYQDADGFDHNCVRCEAMADHDCTFLAVCETATCCVCIDHGCEAAKNERAIHPETQHPPPP